MKTSRQVASNRSMGWKVLTKHDESSPRYICLLDIISVLGQSNDSALYIIDSPA